MMKTRSRNRNLAITGIVLVVILFLAFEISEYARHKREQHIQDPNVYHNYSPDKAHQEQLQTKDELEYRTGKQPHQLP